MKEIVHNNKVLLTASEKARIERKDRVCELYTRLREENPTVACHRLMTHIADEFSLSLSGVRNILIERGLFTPNTIITNNN